MNIAVIFTKDMTEGGAFQYALSLSLLLEKNRSDKHNFIFFTTVKKNLEILKKHNLLPIYLRWSNLDRFKSLLFGSQIVANVFAKAKITLELKLDKIFKSRGIDLVYFLSPTDLALAVNRYNYLFTVWDLCFLDSMEFPEVYANKQFERREELYRLAAAKSIAVVTDSEATKAKIIKQYGVSEERIVSLPLLPSNAVSLSGQSHIDIGKKYGLVNKYIFYPAQFWPHKNHIYILEGIKLLKEKYDIKVDAVFSGSDKGNLSFILKRAKELGIAEKVHCIGFVEDEELPSLYAQALALVMPTYFGPTNIPPLEAFFMGCPVLYSDLPGLREQVKDSALLLDLNDPESLCRGLIKVLNSGPEIKTMIENGKKRTECLMREDRWSKLRAVFDDYAAKLKCRK